MIGRNWIHSIAVALVRARELKRVSGAVRRDALESNPQTISPPNPHDQTPELLAAAGIATGGRQEREWAEGRGARAPRSGRLPHEGKWVNRRVVCVPGRSPAAAGRTEPLEGHDPER